MTWTLTCTGTLTCTNEIVCKWVEIDGNIPVVSWWSPLLECTRRWRKGEEQLLADCTILSVEPLLLYETPSIRDFRREIGVARMVHFPFSSFLKDVEKKSNDTPLFWQNRWLSTNFYIWMYLFLINCLLPAVKIIWWHAEFMVSLGFTFLSFDSSFIQDRLCTSPFKQTVATFLSAIMAKIN